RVHGAPCRGRLRLSSAAAGGRRRPSSRAIGAAALEGNVAVWPVVRLRRNRGGVTASSAPEGRPSCRATRQLRNRGGRLTDWVETLFLRHGGKRSTPGGVFPSQAECGHRIGRGRSGKLLPQGT